MATLFKVTVTMERQEESLTARKWAEGAPNSRNDEGTWGYTDQVTEVKTVQRVVYEQTVDNLNVQAVIEAVNK